MEERLAELRAELASLILEAEGLPGSMGPYGPNPPPRSVQLTRWESSHGVKLPAEYREFLLAVGNGGSWPGLFQEPFGGLGSKPWWSWVVKPGAVAGWMSKYEREGLPIQKRRLNTFLGLYVSEIGRLHTVVLMWAYDSLADREMRRKAMEADPDWKKFIGEVFALDAILTQDVMIMSPAPFSPPVASP